MLWFHETAESIANITQIEQNSERTLTKAFRLQELKNVYKVIKLGNWSKASLSVMDGLGFVSQIHSS